MDNSNEEPSESSLAEKQYFFFFLQDNSSSRSAKKSFSINEEDELQNFSTGSLDTAYENNVTAEFLNSVRNMNVEEVTATLHKIAATNPAFRGISCILEDINVYENVHNNFSSVKR